MNVKIFWIVCLVYASLLAESFQGKSYEHFLLEGFLEGKEVLADLKEASKEKSASLVLHRGDNGDLVYGDASCDEGYCDFTLGTEVYHIDFFNGVYFKRGSQIMKKIWGIRKILKERGGETKVYLIDDEDVKEPKEGIVFLTLRENDWYKLNILSRHEAVLSLENYPLKVGEKVLFFQALLNETQDILIIDDEKLKKFSLFDILYEKKD